MKQWNNETIKAGAELCQAQAQIGWGWVYIDSEFILTVNKTIK
jgi:hypothetical protein